MSHAASQSSKFYKEVEKNGIVWTIKDEVGFPAPKNSEGIRSMPFWLSKSRTEIIIENVPAYKNFKPVEMNLDKFENYWLKELKLNNQLVGINWSGKNATGYDLKPQVLIEWLQIIKPKKDNYFKRIFRSLN